MGRKKIVIEPIAEERNRQVTFMKRKAGLLKKAMELSILCDCEVGVVIFNREQKLFEYASGDIDKLLRRRETYKDDRESQSNEDFQELLVKTNVAAQQGNAEKDAAQQDTAKRPACSASAAAANSALSPSKAEGELDSENGFQAKKKRKMLAVLVPPRGVAAIKHGTSPMMSGSSLKSDGSLSGVSSSDGKFRMPSSPQRPPTMSGLTGSGLESPWRMLGKDSSGLPSYNGTPMNLHQLVPKDLVGDMMVQGSPGGILPDIPADISGFPDTPLGLTKSEWPNSPGMSSHSIPAIKTSPGGTSSFVAPGGTSSFSAEKLKKVADMLRNDDSSMLPQATPSMLPTPNLLPTPSFSSPTLKPMEPAGKP